MKEESPASADKWFNGMLRAISSLENLPTRCALAPEGKDIGREVKQLLYGKRGNVYRIIFVIRDNEVHVLLCAAQQKTEPYVGAGRRRVKVVLESSRASAFIEVFLRYGKITFLRS